MIAAGIGEIIYEEEPSLEYRRTGENVTPGGHGFLKLQIFRIKKFLFSDYCNQINAQIRKFYDLYYNELNEKDKKLIKLFTRDRHSFVNIIKKTFYPKMFRQNIRDEISLRFMFLIGRL